MVADKQTIHAARVQSERASRALFLCCALLFAALPSCMDERLDP